MSRPLQFRYLTPAELAEQAKPRCPSRPSPRSQAQCEFPEGHTGTVADGGGIFHAGRTRAGYWRFWETRS